VSTREDAPDGAVLLARSVLAPAIRHLAQARERGELAVDDPHHLSERYLRRWPEKSIAAAPPAPALHQAMVFEIEQDLLEELLGHVVALRDLGDEHGLVVALRGQHEQGAKRVFGLLR